MNSKNITFTKKDIRCFLEKTWCNLLTENLESVLDVKGNAFLRKIGTKRALKEEEFVSIPLDPVFWESKNIDKNDINQKEHYIKESENAFKILLKNIYGKKEK